jgi:hypothetical protein
VIVQILVRQRHAEDALAQQHAHRMLDQIRIAPILKALRQPLEQSRSPIGLLQQQRPSIRTDPSAIERCHHPTLLDTRKLQLLRATLCRHRDPWGQILRQQIRELPGMHA